VSEPAGPDRSSSSAGRGTSELDEFLARAVDRQIAEQRALRETLTQLRDELSHIQSQPTPTVDMDELDERLRRHIERSLEMAAGDLRGAVSGVSADVEGIAQALIDMNSGLRAWADGIDRSINTVLQTSERVREVVGGVHEMQTRAIEAMRTSNAQSQQLLNQVVELTRASAAQSSELQAQTLESATATADHTRELHTELRGMQGDLQQMHAELMESAQAAEARAPAGGYGPLIGDETAIVPSVGLEGSIMPAPAITEFANDIEQQVKESIELSLYLADQIEDFDRVIGKMGDLPNRLEAVITQALKRTLAARGKLDREAEIALDDVLTVVDEHAERIGSFGESEEVVRDLTSGQDELSSRVETLHADVLDRLEVLAEAIDRSHAGKTPRAAAALARGSRSSRAKSGRSKAKSTKKGSSAAAKRNARRRAKPKNSDDDTATD
jgi:SMC interacting uncharacterized protein involved in chromosome segregation